MLLCQLVARFTIFDKLPFVVFKGPADARHYVVIIFLPNCQYGDVCEVKTRVEIFKKEAEVDNFLIRFRWSVFSPPRNTSNISKIDHLDLSLETKTMVLKRR